MSVLPYLVATWLLVVGLWGVITSRHLVRTVLCLTVVQSSTYVLLLAVGYRTGGKAPIITTTVPPSSQFVDPIVQALTLTDVVVEATVVAVLLALVVQAHKRFGTADPDEMGEISG
jgi:multicomponent Na+:H+ antiporter subunit C